MGQRRARLCRPAHARSEHEEAGAGAGAGSEGAVRTSQGGLDDLEAGNVAASSVGVALVALVGAGFGCRAHGGR